MALINCPECKKQVSDKAPACPHCGTTIAGTPRSQIEGKDAVIVLGAAVAGLFLAIIGSSVAPEGSPLKIALGLGLLIAPPAGALVYTQRKR